MHDWVYFQPFVSGSPRGLNVSVSYRNSIPAGVFRWGEFDPFVAAMRKKTVVTNLGDLGGTGQIQTMVDRTMVTAQRRNLLQKFVS